MKPIEETFNSSTVFKMCLKYKNHIKMAVSKFTLMVYIYPFRIISAFAAHSSLSLWSKSFTKHAENQQSINFYFKTFHYPIVMNIVLIYFLYGPELEIIFSIR